MIDIDLRFNAKLWASGGKGEWYFVTLPVAIAKQVKALNERHYGYGTIRVRVRLGETEWKTSLFPSNKDASYYLPIKAEVRRRENLVVGSALNVIIFLTL